MFLLNFKWINICSFYIYTKQKGSVERLGQQKRKSLVDSGDAQKEGSGWDLEPRASDQR